MQEIIWSPDDKNYKKVTYSKKFLTIQYFFGENLTIYYAVVDRFIYVKIYDIEHDGTYLMLKIYIWIKTLKNYERYILNYLNTRLVSHLDQLIEDSDSNLVYDPKIWVLTDYDRRFKKLKSLNE